MVKWSTPWLAKVAADDAGCTWAPEAIYDEQTNDYMVYWSSTSKSDNYSKQRVWSAHTADFKEFSTPEIFIDKVSTVYDTDIIHAGSRYYRFSKDSMKKAITMEVAEKLAGPWTGISAFTPTATQGYEGPAAFELNPQTWCLMLDHPSRTQGYTPFTTTDLASGKFTPSNEFKFPFVFRHGSVLPLSADEYQRVKSTYGPMVTPK